MKSLVMSLFLLSVALGSAITALVNNYIQTPSPLAKESSEAHTAIHDSSAKISPHHEGWLSKRYAGYDQTLFTDDDIVTHFTSKSVIKKRDIPAESSLLTASKIIEDSTLKSQRKLPITELGNSLIQHLQDPWGNALSYRLMNGETFRITSMGPDKESLTEWDTGIKVTLKHPEEAEASSSKDLTWIDQRKQQLGITNTSEHSYDNDPNFERSYLAGGLYKLEGAAYFWFFTSLMLVTAILFIPTSLFYGAGKKSTD